MTTTACTELVACERAGRVWRDTLVSFDVQSGRWGAPCVDVYGPDACTGRRDPLLLLTHLPKAGGSGLGAALGSVSSKTGSPLEACHLLWNGLDRASVCTALRSWVRRRSIRQSPPLPHGAQLAARSGMSANASLVSSVPFRHCASLWAQHVDFSVVELVRSAHPHLAVRPVMLVRHPVSLFFSEFLYKRHCLWRQQGLRAPDAASALSLSEHITRLRKSPDRRLLLTHFLAGSSWCSCSPDRNVRRALPAATLRARALANAATYWFIGTVERAAPSMRLLGRLLGLEGAHSSLHTRSHAGFAASLSRSRLESARGEGTAGLAGWAANRTNALGQCVDSSSLPPADRPSVAQRAEVTALLAEDISLYMELDSRLSRQLHGQQRAVK